jgi:phosphate starvation-inducible PhoH-like protein
MARNNKKPLKTYPIEYKPGIGDKSQTDTAWQELRDKDVESRIKFKPLNKKQEIFFNCIQTNTLTFCLGPAGTGKNWVSVYLACKDLLEGKIERIVLTRPSVACDEEIGFLPGDVSAKLIPFMAPILDILENFLGEKKLDELLKSGKIEMLPLGFIRGHSFKNSIILADEMQNASYGQIKALITRISTNCRMIITGDVKQTDLFDDEKGGLVYMINKLKPLIQSKEISYILFNKDDVVRSGLVKKIVELTE